MRIPVHALEAFLNAVDADFPVPLSKKQELGAYARKLCEKATLCAIWEGDKILSLAAGYTDNLPDGKAYLAVVATRSEARGRGLGAKTVGRFMDICRRKGIGAVHLYAVSTNIPAMRMYQGLGFRPLVLADEPRPEDAHLICYFEGAEA